MKRLIGWSIVVAALMVGFNFGSSVFDRSLAVF